MFLLLLQVFVASVVCFLGFVIWKEFRQWNSCWPYGDSHEAMTSIAAQKPDHEMTDAEFNTKYSAFRHDAGRMCFFQKNIKFLNKYLHYMELYLFHGGPSRLAQKIRVYKPVFIIGDFRSGTSVLERLICHHPKTVFFRMNHSVVWSAPGLWTWFFQFFGNIRRLTGHSSWMHPSKKGIYFPHSSNVLLHRDRPFEAEILWHSCPVNLNTCRDNRWESLDSASNLDNQSNLDYVTEAMRDPAFEDMFVNSVRMLIANFATPGCDNSPGHDRHHLRTRFVLKNPLNGFRVRFLRRLFPDAQFIHIARNPLKTTLSQMLMTQSCMRAFFIDEMHARRHGNRPPLEDHPDSWNRVCHGVYPNQAVLSFWMPRVFPRTVPEYQQITRYLKQGKTACATATAVCQHERVALESFRYINAKEGVDVITIFHEQLLQDASSLFEKVMEFIQLSCTDQQRLEFLEREDFPGGQANRKRVKKSNKHEKKVNFGDETKEVYDIIQNNPVWHRYMEMKTPK